MKSFKSFKDAFKWTKGLIDEASLKAKAIIAEEVYKDSDKYTYRDTGTMYDSGALHSDFKKGYVVERTPYSRRRYYEGGKPGKGNPRAVIQWFERTKKENINKYKKQYSLVFKQVKGGG